MKEESGLIDLLSKIDRKLGFIVGEKIKSKHALIKTQIVELMSLTNDYKEIATILGISPKHASVELSKIKKGAGK
jgi:hypothetical protein